MSTHSSPATIRDIAQLAGVSVATVSRYLNKNAPVSAKVGQRIQQAIEQLHYVPQASNRHQPMPPQNTVGLLLSNMHNQFFAPLLIGVEAVVRQHNYNLLVATCRTDRHEEGPFPLGAHNIDGLLAFADSLNEEQMTAFYDQRLPLVLAYKIPPADLPIPFVTINHQLAVYTAVTHLITAHGRRRILFVRPHQPSQEQQRQELGYRTALAEHGLPIEESLILQLTDSPYRCLSSLMQAPNTPEFDALFTPDDATAVEIYQALHEAARHIPTDVSVVGFGNSPIAPFLAPPLTTTQLPVEAIGRAAAEKLFALLAGQPPQRTTIYSTQTIIRQSCGCSIL